MPSAEHELPLEMVRNRPQLVPVILRTIFGCDVPDDGRVTLTSESYAGFDPAELRCDATVLLDDPGDPNLGVVVESQLRYDETKIYSWPAYLALLRLRRKCKVSLLVFCPDAAVARACAAPIDMGHPEWVLRPLTLHPGMLPPITDRDEACRLPELAVLSAPAHADGPDGVAVIDSVAAALDTLPGDTGALYNDYIMSRLSEAARDLMEKTVKIENYEWQSEFARTHIAKGKAEGEAKGRAEGRAEGEANLLLIMLEERGIEVPDEVRERIMGCADTGQLERWLRRGLTANSADEIFD